MNAAALRHGTQWSEVDFDRMDWHDVHIHAMAAVADRFEVRFDIDYICEWLCAPSTGGPSQFRIAPATLIFKNAGTIKARFDSQQGLASINKITRASRERRPGASVDTWDWTIECHEGEISFEASGFRMVLRAPPVLVDLQYLNSEQRGLPSLDG